MIIPRWLVLGPLMSLCVAAAAAQASPQNASDSSQPTPVLSQNVEAGTDFFPLSENWQSYRQSYWQDSLNSTPGSIQGERGSGKMPAPVHTQHILTLGQNEETCLTLRTYRVARVSPDSDTTRPAGYSTCQRASRFELKTAVDSKVIEPR
jgi:hypothetical protein